MKQASPPPSGNFKTRLGRFDYIFRGNCATLTLTAETLAFVRGKAFGEIRVHLYLQPDKTWKAEHGVHLIKRKETLHETTPAQAAEIYQAVTLDWNNFWEDQKLIQMQFQKYRRTSEIQALQIQRDQKLGQLSELLIQIKTLNDQIDDYL